MACECTCSFTSFPVEWLFHTRWGKGKSASHDYHGNLITFDTVGGRTSAIVSAVQKKTFKEGTGAAPEGARSSKYFSDKQVKQEEAEGEGGGEGGKAKKKSAADAPAGKSTKKPRRR